MDASAAVAALLNAGSARRAVGSEQLHAPHLIDCEVANAVRRRVVAGTLAPDAGWLMLSTWRRLGVMRHPVTADLERMWQLRENLTAYDASYVALAERLDCDLLTADSRLSRAPGIRCAITLVPH